MIKKNTIVYLFKIAAMLKTNEWNKKGKGWVYKFKVDFFENNMRDSRITWFNNGVGELYYNIKTEYPLNQERNQKILGKLLKEKFKTKYFICVVDGRYKTKGENSFSTTVKFYFKVDERPSGVEDIPQLIYDNVVPQEYMRTDAKTGETEFYDYWQLREMFTVFELSIIIRLCYNPIDTKNKSGHQTVKGGYWSFS